MLNIMKILMKKILNLKVGDLARISKYKNIFAKGYTQSWSEEVFVVCKIKNTVPWTYVIRGLMVKQLEAFMNKNCKNLVKKI